MGDLGDYWRGIKEHREHGKRCIGGTFTMDFQDNKAGNEP